MEFTPEEIEDIIQADLYWKEHQRKKAIKNLFIRDSIDYDINNYNFFKRCFLWVKALICLCLKRTSGSYLDLNSFCIVSYDQSFDMYGSSWEACWISSKYFKGWNVCLGTDGT